MSIVIPFPENTTPQVLAENFAALAEEGKVRWAILAYADDQGDVQYEWTQLPNGLTAVGAAFRLAQEIERAG